MSTQNLFHFAGGDVLSAADDHIFFAVDYVQVALFIKAADVAGVQPAVAQGVSGFRGLLPVPEHALVCLDQYFPALVRIACLRRVTRQFNVRCGQRLAHGLQQLGALLRCPLMVGHRQKRHTAGQLRHAVALAQAHIGLRQQPAQQGLRHGRSTIADGAHGAQVGRAELRVVQQHGYHGRRQRHGRHLQFAAGVECFGRIK